MFASAILLDLFLSSRRCNQRRSGRGRDAPSPLPLVSPPHGFLCTPLAVIVPKNYVIIDFFEYAFLELLFGG